MIVAAGFAVIAVVVATWVSVNRRPPEWDHANHLERAIECAHDLAKGDVHAIIGRTSFYPPLVPCAAGLVYRLVPSDAAGAQAVMLGFLGMGMGATYMLGRMMSGVTAGVAAALLFGSAPFVVFSSLNFQLDLPLAAMVAVALLALLRTDAFNRRGWSLVAGLVFALGMWTKPPFAVYVLPALGMVAWRVRDRRRALNLALAGLVAGALSLPWYGPRLIGLPAQIGNRSFKQAAESGHPGLLTWAGLGFYPRWFVAQFGVFAVLACCAGFVLAVRRRQVFPVLAVLAPLIVFELLQNKNLRYTLPLLPVAAVLAGTAVSALRGRWRPTACIALLAAGIVQVAGTAFGVPRPFTLPGIDVPWALQSPPSPADWKQREILALITRHSGGGPRRVSIVPNFAVFSKSNFSYYAARDGLTLRIDRAWQDEPVAIDYMVLKSGDVGPSWTADKLRRIAERFATDPYLARVYPVIGEFPLPDGSVATVRARAVAPVPSASPPAVGAAMTAALRRQLGDYARNVDGLGVVLEYDDAVLSGRVRRVDITARAATVGELRRRNAGTLTIRDVHLVIDDLLVNPYSALEAKRFDLLDAGRVAIESATIQERDLQAFLGTQKDFRHARMTFENGALRFLMEQPGPDVSARVRFLSAHDRPLELAAEDVRVGGVPVPQALVSWVVRTYDPLPRIASRLPMPIDVGRITIDGNAIRISGTPP